jgi:hypothetical protein
VAQLGPNEIIPIAGMVTGVLVVGAISWGFVRLFQGPVGQAIAKRITGKVTESDSELVGEVLELRHQVEELHRRLGEAEERLDFNERLLAKTPEPGKLPGSRS